MTLAYAPGDSLAHRLDPRTKLAFQAGFALAAFAATTPAEFAALTAVALLASVAARISPVDALSEYRFALLLLAVAPVVRALTWGSPWLRPADAVPAVVAGCRVLLLLLVAAAYVRTTPVRESRAAIGWLVPGRAGAFLGMGVAFVFRFLPLLQADLARVREATAARLGTERPLHERMELVGAAGLSRALARVDTLSLALRARCLAWNPTLPRLRFRRGDALGLLLAAALAGFAALQTFNGW